MNTVIYHRADFDGLFCREIAKRFLPPDTKFIGWDFGDEPIEAYAIKGTIYILDLPVDRVLGMEFPRGAGPREAKGFERIIWIDHHKSSIESHPQNIPGYRIDGVAACRLAWQYFWHFHPTSGSFSLPTFEQFREHMVREPLAVRLTGEYDIWDKRDPRAELFQHGLRSKPLTDSDWAMLLDSDAYEGWQKSELIDTFLRNAAVISYVREQEYAEVIKDQGFDVEFEGLKFLACCSHECDIRSHLFAAGIQPHHDALFGFTFTGKDWRVSLYHAPGKEHYDLSEIAKRYGGGGHRGACGFRVETLPFLPS